METPSWSSISRVRYPSRIHFCSKSESGPSKFQLFETNKNSCPWSSKFMIVVQITVLVHFESKGNFKIGQNYSLTRDRQLRRIITSLIWVQIFEQDFCSRFGVIIWTRSAFVKRSRDIEVLKTVFWTKNKTPYQRSMDRNRAKFPNLQPKQDQRIFENLGLTRMGVYPILGSQQSWSWTSRFWSVPHTTSFSIQDAKLYRHFFAYV